MLVVIHQAFDSFDVYGVGCIDIRQVDDLLFALVDAAERLQRVMLGHLKSSRQGLLVEVGLLRRGIELGPKRLELAETINYIEKNENRH